MSIVTAKCPHCKVDSIGLKVVHGNKVHFPVGERNKPPTLAANLSCPNCNRPSCAELTAVSGNLTVEYHFDAMLSTVIADARDLSAHGLKLNKFWPEAQKPRIPDHLDPDAARALLQAERNFEIAGNEEAAATMYRRALEVSLKKAFPGGPDNLSRHIKKLVADGKLTDTIGDWADHIREIGNEAVHETGPLDRNDLIAMREFTDAVLRYAISLPKEIETRRNATVPEETIASVPAVQG
ncbi:DUF4145 domain-containing protein [Methylobacterium brachiatum]|uniref:DUF4145 domain-containing protein n=1 Tax=Methylobacterium brachiatum TaxID=269660 RepID=UPI002448E19F|nr:DUF4145 domain-containing protein [Methylobacterium brachiatum]MDH2311455.1 DUF4145 domain-containing protein [Methylobacterium brachiatum]